MKERVLEIIKRNLERPLEVKMESNLREDLNIDSLATIMIINDLEDEFDIEINEDDFKDVVLARDIVRKLEKHMGSKA